MVHRDLKPSNMLLSSRGENGVIKITDFGFACSVNNGPLTVRCGTPHFVAPEILKAQRYSTVR